MSSYLSLFNEQRFTGDIIDVIDLTVSGTLNLTGATITGFPIDNITLTQTANIFGVKDGGIDTKQLADDAVTDIKISDMDAVKLTGTLTINIDNSETKTDALYIGAYQLEETLGNLTAAEIAQLANINTNTISTAQWGFLAAMDQSLSTSSSPTFAALKLSNSGFNITIAAPTLAASSSYVLPATDGTAGYVLSTDGAGNLSWATNPSFTAQDSYPFASNTGSGIWAAGIPTGNEMDLKVNGTTYMTLTDGNGVNCFDRFLLPAGSAILPAYSFTGATTSGIYLDGSDYGFSLAATKIAGLSSTQLTIPSGALATPGLAFLEDTDSGIFFDSKSNPAFKQMGFVSNSVKRYWSDDQKNYMYLPLEIVKPASGGDTSLGVFTEAYNIMQKIDIGRHIVEFQIIIPKTNSEVITSSVEGDTILYGMNQNIHLCPGGNSDSVIRCGYQDVDIRKPTTITKSSNGNVLTLRTGSTSYYPTLNIGRASADATISIPASAAQFCSNSVAGDLVIRSENSQNIHLTSGSGTSELRVSDGQVSIGSSTATGVLLGVSNGTGGTQGIQGLCRIMNYSDLPQTPAGFYRPIAQFGGRTNNQMLLNMGVYREDTSTNDWLSASFVDWVAVDAAFGDPSSTGKCWIRRKPSAGSFTFGNATSTIMTMDTSAMTIPNTTASTSKTTGALIVAGGLGVSGSSFIGATSMNTTSAYATLNLAGDICHVSTGNSARYKNCYFSTGTGTFVFDAASEYAIMTLMQASLGEWSVYTSPTTSTGAGTNASMTKRFRVNPTQTISVNPLSITDTTISSSKTTGALIVSGGVGISGALYTGAINTTGTMIITDGTENFRIIHAGGVSYIQAGQDHLDTTAHVRFCRYSTSGTNLAQFDVYADSINLLGGDVTMSSQPIALRYNNALQTLTTATPTMINFNTTTVLTNITATSSSRYTLAYAGRYNVKADILFNFGGSGSWAIYLEIVKNGVSSRGVQEIGDATFKKTVSIDCTISCNVGDYFEIRATQSSGGNLSVGSTAIADSNRLMITKIS